MLFFGSNLWKYSKTKYAFEPLWKQRVYNCIGTGHGKAGWLGMFCRDMMADKQHSTAAMLPTLLLEGRFSILGLAISIAQQTACLVLDPACVGITSSCWAPFSVTSYIPFSVTSYICQACAWTDLQAISLMKWHLGQTLSPQKRLTHEDTRKVNLLRKIPKHHQGRDIPSRERKQKENQVMLFSSGCNKTETSHRHVSLLPLQSMYKSVIEECIYYGSMYVCIFKVA